MSEFVANPRLWPEIERAVLRELDDVRENAYREVKSHLTPSSIKTKATVRTTPAKRVARREMGVFIGYGKGLGPIFESGTKQRFTKGRGRKGKYGAGINRGRISTANHAMKTAQTNALRRGLTLRYL
jgi:hypothetical protein